MVPRNTVKTRATAVTIYALSDPLDDCVRYVGMTRTNLGTRIHRHLKEPTNAAMRRWFAYVRKIGLSPRITALEYVNETEWEDAERGWVYWFKQRGQLLNVDPGGKYRDRNGIPREVELGPFQPPVSVRKVEESKTETLPPGILTGKMWQQIKGENLAKRRRIMP